MSMTMAPSMKLCLMKSLFIGSQLLNKVMKR